MHMYMFWTAGITIEQWPGRFREDGINEEQFKGGKNSQ